MPLDDAPPACFRYPHCESREACDWPQCSEPSPLSREDFPPRRPGQLGWVLHSGSTTIRIVDLPDTDWPGTIEFLAKCGKREWKFCAHEPHC